MIIVHLPQRVKVVVPLMRDKQFISLDYSDPTVGMLFLPVLRLSRGAPWLICPGAPEALVHWHPRQVLIREIL
jgi:hypothetical protein